MSEDWAELGETLKQCTIWMLSSLGDAAFLALWVAVQWLANSKVFHPLKLTGMDKFVLLTFQMLFSISTLAPVAITTYRDIRIMLLRTQRRIRQEVEQSERNEPD